MGYTIHPSTTEVSTYRINFMARNGSILRRSKSDSISHSIFLGSLGMRRRVKEQKTRTRCWSKLTGARGRHSRCLLAQADPASKTPFHFKTIRGITVMGSSQEDGNEAYPIGTVVLTDDEQQECNEMLHFFVTTLKEQEDNQEGEVVIKQDYAETFQRGIVAYTLMRRAERFLEMAGGSAIDTTLHVAKFRGIPLDPDLCERACVAAAKACATLPLSVHFYDFGCILTQIGQVDEAKVAFSTFLRKVVADYSNGEMGAWLKARDIQAHVQFAEQMI